MGTESRTKINQLINQWVSGTPGATSYLGHLGFGRDLLVKYKKSGWLTSFGRGAYMRSGDNVGLPGALYTLQKQLGLSIYAVGKTALMILICCGDLPPGWTIVWNRFPVANVSGLTMMSAP